MPESSSKGMLVRFIFAVIVLFGILSGCSEDGTQNQTEPRSTSAPVATSTAVPTPMPTHTPAGAQSPTQHPGSTLTPSVAKTPALPPTPTTEATGTRQPVEDFKPGLDLADLCSVLGAGWLWLPKTDVHHTTLTTIPTTSRWNIA